MGEGKAKADRGECTQLTGGYRWVRYLWVRYSVRVRLGWGGQHSGQCGAVWRSGAGQRSGGEVGSGGADECGKHGERARIGREKETERG